MESSSSPVTSDPRPQPPEKPLPQDCCDSGCQMCVNDVYAAELEGYRLALALWLQRHPEAGKNPDSAK